MHFLQNYEELGDFFHNLSSILTSNKECRPIQYKPEINHGKRGK